MCNFLSAIVLRNGDVLTHPMLDSHSDLVAYYALPDTTAHHQHFAKVELTPVDWLDPTTWRFRLDEETAPSWWEDVATGVEAEMRRRAVGKDRVDRKDVVAGHAVAQRPRPAGIVAGHAADRGARRGRDVDGEPQPMRAQEAVEIIEHDAGLDDANAVLDVKRQEAIQVL